MNKFTTAVKNSNFNEESDMLHNASVTENGMLGFKSTGNPILDLNFALSSMRSWGEEQIKNSYINALRFDHRHALEWLFMIGDIRQGAGERRTFNLCIQELAAKYPVVAVDLLSLIPEYTRWDYVCKLAVNDRLPKNVQFKALELIKEQLDKDINDMEADKPISLLGKWLPSNNTSSKQTQHEAYTIRTYLGMTEAVYRKTLSRLRKYLQVVETYITSGDWSNIDYSKVPSKANLKYSKVFLNHDNERRIEFINKAKNGEDGAKLISSVSYPYEIVDLYENYIDSCCRRSDNITDNDEYELLWKGLPDFSEGKDVNVLCVLDSSGSMTWPCAGNTRPITIARALTLYFSERLNSEYKNTCLEFSATTRWINLGEDTSLCKRLIHLRKYSDCSNTNLELVFQKVLDVAVEHNLNQEDLPQNLMIISDMEFDAAVSHRYDQGIQVYNNVVCKMRKAYEEKGYKLPGLIFWNICSKTNTIPILKNDNGLILLSGFSPSMVKMVLTGEIDPVKALYSVLDSKRYEAIRSVADKHSNLFQ